MLNKFETMSLRHGVSAGCEIRTGMGRTGSTEVSSVAAPSGTEYFQIDNHCIAMLRGYFFLINILKE
jgi:hypothetical protein